ncbi:MAG: IS21 family transposase, partial [Balneolaceae bacterium]
MITNKRKEYYMNLRNEGDTQELAAAKANISLRSAKRIDKPKPDGCSPNNPKRGIKKDPFEEVWQLDLVPLLENEPTLQALTLLEDLQEKFPGQYDGNLLRTLQRRVKDWKAINGPEKEVIFRQNHPPGWQGLSDFTDCDELLVTILGKPFPHIYYRFYLAFSHWEYTHVITGGESFPALSEGFQNALFELQGCPLTHRTDSLAAAFKNSGQPTEKDFTDSYEELCANYNIKPTRNNKGVKHENGSVESSHRHFKSKVNQALMLRGSRDFDSL